MTSVLDLIRPDLRAYAGYPMPAHDKAKTRVWLNANESAWKSLADAGAGVNRYPEGQPDELLRKMSELYDVAKERLMITRGSDEGIDLIVRAFCRAGLDGVLVAPPCFPMYAVAAKIQNAPIVEVPLVDDGKKWSVDLTAVIDIVKHGDVRVVFLATPANPTGHVLTIAEIRKLASATKDRAALVIDEAYAEFSTIGSARELLVEFPHLILLRTLSKAYALAGARVGAVIAHPEVVRILRSLEAPFPIPSPSAALAIAALTRDALTPAREHVAIVLKERAAVARALGQLKLVKRVYPSQGNFLLVRFKDPDEALTRLTAKGIVIRDVRSMPQLQDAFRISIGAPEENQAVLDALLGGAAK